MPFDAKRLSNTDWMIAGGGLVAFIALFLPWWGVDIGPFSVSRSGWNAGFAGVLGALLVFVAGLYLFLRRSEVSMPDLPVGPAVAVAGASVLGVLLIFLRLVTLPSYRGVDVGARFGIFIALIAGIVQLVGAVMAFRESGEALPWAGDKPETSGTP